MNSSSARDHFFQRFLNSISDSQLTPDQTHFLSQLITTVLLDAKTPNSNSALDQVWENQIYQLAGGFISEREELLQAMNLLQTADQLDQDKERAVKKMISQLKPSQPIAGFNSSNHLALEDENVRKIFNLARQANLPNDFPNLAQMIEAELAQLPRKKQLLNYLGASAACLLALGISPSKAQQIWALGQWTKTLMSSNSS